MRDKLWLIPSNIIEVVGEILMGGLKYLWDSLKVRKKKASKQVAEQEAIQQGEEKVSDIIEVSRILNQLLEDLNPSIQKVEDDIIDEIAYYLEEFIGFIKEKEEILTSKGIRVIRIVNELERIKKKFRGELSKRVNRELSLDNIECREILSMRAGEKKKDKMDAFVDVTFERVLQDMIYDIKEEILYVAKDIRDVIKEDIELIKYNLKEKTEAYQQLVESIRQRNNKKQEIIKQVIVKIGVIEEIKSIINEGDM